MLFGKTKLELKVGIFVFIGVTILVLFVLSLGGFKTWTSGYNVHFVFNFVNGVKVGAPVRFAGVDVGEVKRIDYAYSEQENKTKVNVVAWVKNDVRIPSDSTIWVNTLGLLGEKYVEIIPGVDYKNSLAQEGAIVGVDPLAMHDLVRLADSVVENINESIIKIKNKEGTVGKLLYDDTIYKELEALVKDIRAHPWKLFFKTKEKPQK